ncbi:Hypothetical protein NCS54_00518500 [Fusarium falciforme]|uniref:NADH-ubiquinone oxidoreductase 21.3 kDa subunit n=1 Tax=Fusarium falciforme TaxID=195108 RepID=A0A9W8V6D0_9HYPO|nr:Hypothetical protein NCS54_00518500 [Fusarium falciforme]KAJ4197404.1 hypothetical protein NW755_000097 [Fusarium falciforme]KAJ4209449.1 hypothetical protein NW767_001359 [Fusarium falciforme]KAJ4262757.1 hypothetical protein NW757_001014 [Fusarium falciforme]WAO87863.1 Hypothetical protein NCS54_00518500 [Fusarium falciforme]
MEHPKSATPRAHFEPSTVFKPYDVLDDTAKAGLIGGASGLFIASIRNALAKTNVGALSVFTRGAPIIGLATAAPAAYVFFSRTAMNLREENDPWSAGFGGFMMGAVLGLPSRRMPVVMGLGASIGVFQGMFYYLGNRYDTFKKEDNTFERKETARRTTRLPLEQTISEIGEGRGIQPPGYDERRAERLKEKYGFEVNPVNATIAGSQ